MEGQNFCGNSVTIECPSIEIKAIPSLDFQIWFIDNLAELVSKSISPKIVPRFFEPDEGIDNQMVIMPSEINDLHFIQSSRTFGFELRLYTNKEAVESAYGEILAIVKVIINVIQALTVRKSFVYQTRFRITQSGVAVLTVSITRTV